MMIKVLTMTESKGDDSEEIKRNSTSEAGEIDICYQWQMWPENDIQ